MSETDNLKQNAEYLTVKEMAREIKCFSEGSLR